MNPTAYEMAQAREAAPRNRAQRRAMKQGTARTERARRRSQNRIVKALGAYSKGSAA